MQLYVAYLRRGRELSLEEIPRGLSEGGISGYHIAHIIATEADLKLRPMRRATEGNLVRVQSFPRQGSDEEWVAVIEWDCDEGVNEVGSIAKSAQLNDNRKLTQLIYTGSKGDRLNQCTQSSRNLKENVMCWKSMSKSFYRNRDCNRDRKYLYRAAVLGVPVRVLSLTRK